MIEMGLPYDSFEAPRRTTPIVISRLAMSALVAGISLGGLVIGLKTSGLVYFPKEVVLIGLASLCISLSILAFRYLIGGQIDISEIASSIQYEFNPTKTASQNALRNEMRIQRKKIRALSDEIENLKSVDRQNSYDDISERLKNKILSSASSEFMESVERKVDRFTNTELYKGRLALKSFENTRTRIDNTIIGLGRRGAINLIIGGFVTLIGAAMLWKFAIVDSPKDANPAQYIMHFVPRLAIVALVQVFALFFLKLYKIGLEEIKYFQNELTNIEQREVAISLALLADDPPLRSSILDTISKTDRNNVLEKGQTTVEIEKAKLEGVGGSIDLIKAIAPILAKK